MSNKSVDRGELKVAALREGTVIDHIPANSLFKVISILGLDKISSQITFGSGLDSGKLGKKSIIKISGKMLSQDEVNKVSLIAPNASINIIKDFAVVQKMTLDYPEEVVDAIQCINPKCITNHEPMRTRFRAVKAAQCLYVCNYCERTISVEDLIIK